MSDREKDIKVSWSNPPTLEQLKADLQGSVLFNNQYIEKIDKWLDLLHVKGTEKKPKVEGKSNVQPKLIRKQLEWRLPSLVAPFIDSEKLISVLPRTARDKYAAEQNEIILNTQFNKIISKRKFFGKYCRVAATQGTVFVRVGWEYQEEKRKVEYPIYDYVEATEEDMLVLQHAVQLQQEDYDQFLSLVPETVHKSLEMTLELGRPVMAVDTGDVEEVEETVITKNQPTLEHVDYRRLYVDPNCKDDIDDAEYIIYEFQTSLHDLNNNGNYKNLDVVKTQVDASTLTDEQIEKGISHNYEDDTRKLITAHEYWGNWDIDGNGTTKPVLITWVGNTIIRMEENPYPDKKHPFVSVQYIPNVDSIYGEADAELLDDTQRIYGATMRSMIDILGRTANGQQGIAQNLLDPVNKRRYQRGDHYEFNPNHNPQSGIITHTSPEIPQSALVMLQLQNKEAESLSGIKAYSDGLDSGSLGDVASGIRGVLDSTSKRDADILGRLAEGVVKIARKMLALNAVYLSEEEVVRITEDKFVTIRKDDLEGYFDLELTISTAEEENNRANQLAFMTQTLGNSVPFDITKLLLAEIAKLRKMPSLAKKLENFTPEPDPIEQEKKQLELQLLRAQIENEQHKSMASRARALVDAARASNLDADTKQKILDFVEEEKGVKHERSKELHQAQAEGNMKLELLKSVLNNQSTQKPERTMPQETGATNV